jgi:hypothetical protein
MCVCVCVFAYLKYEYVCIRACIRACIRVRIHVLVCEYVYNLSVWLTNSCRTALDP